MLSSRTNMSTEDFPDDYNIPKFGWKVKMDHVFEEKWNQNLRPRWHQIYQFIPLALRYVVYHMYNAFHSRQPLMNYIKMETGKQIYGAPIGGIGGGTIGRGYRGEFCRFQLRPGRVEYNTVPANNFIVTVQDSQNKTVYQKVLSTYPKPKKQLSAWEWDFDGSQAEYTALYPRAWSVFRIPDYSLTLVCRQVSPVIPDNYKDSTLPGAVFVWTVHNEGTEMLHVSITFTFKNGCGRKDDRDPNCVSTTLDRKAENGTQAVGVQISHRMDAMDYTYGLAVKKKDGVSISRMLRFDPAGSGADIWDRLLEKGELWAEPETCNPTASGEQLGAAVCSRLSVPASSSLDTEMALVWDMPKVHFQSWHTRYYTTQDFTTASVSGSEEGARQTSASVLCAYALENFAQWEEAIDKWQQPILDDSDLPEWYISALFNELYFVADGGTVWLVHNDKNIDPTYDPRHKYGRFAYLEGHEYRMYNTYDVHFYASFALAMLWPKLQEVLQYDIRDTLEQENKTQRWHLYDGKSQDRKVKNTVPHDVGDPEEDPFKLINAYPIHDVSEWRDLNLKYVLQVWRDFSLTKNERYLADMWASCKKVMDTAEAWDTDGDGLIENNGSPDQTYDTWVMKGPSAYCGGLWLAALYCMHKMAVHFADTDAIDKYAALLERGKQSFEEKLWNGQYYDFDSSQSSHSKSVMSDQLCGQWYLRACGVTDEVFPSENVKSALKTIFRLNVMGFCEGRMGAVNGVLPSGQVDTTTIQSEEVWTGVVYGLCALMIHENMEEEAFLTAGGMFNTVYNRIGLGFETPEALYEKDHYRAIGYMRPLAIWAMQLAWQQRKNHKLPSHKHYAEV
ncbi:Non-lysosomal glucosylceramidase [Frankliniella fusca]|uniref:Non-lysosomal glucosylceramidase n=1 Tax=Frankliniella fusca TaxID=407009 RepID=A0AAE1GYC4_9NEOP|nr:Non-lysosomal glucosylceramidase [Frankliniella fusca]